MSAKRTNNLNIAIKINENNYKNNPDDNNNTNNALNNLENIKTTSFDIENKKEPIVKSNLNNQNSINNIIQPNEEEPFPAKQNKFSQKFKKSYKIIKNAFSKKSAKQFFKKHFLNKTDIILYIINILSIIFYYLGLTPCYKDPSECTIKKGIIFYFIIGTFTAISAILYSIYISITLFKKKHFFHYIYTVPIFFYFIIRYTGAETRDHGFYNSFSFIGIILIFTPILLFFLIIIDLMKKKHYIILIFISTFISILIIIYNNLPGFSCENWDLGLNNTRIDNDKSKYPCHILIPGKNKCYLNKFDGLFDFSRILRPTCSAESILNGEKKIFLKSLSNRYFGVSKLNHFGYPITTKSDKYSMYSVEDLRDFQQLVTHNIIKMDLYNDENYPDEPYPEVEVFFDENNHGIVKVNLTKNETLSQERKNISETRHSLYNNVLIVYIDAISRNHFRRKMTKLSKYIKPFMMYELNETEKHYSAFEFLKYNTLKGLTLPNIKAMFYGVSLNESEGVNLVKYFKEQGYVTGHTGTTCGKEIFSVNTILQSQNLVYDNWDHENIALFCDNNFFDYNYSIKRGVASILKRCLYGKYAFEYMIEYAKQFWKSYPNNKKFFRIHFNEGHEGTMELVKYLADPLFEFVKYFFDNKLLDDTFIFIVSDHGNHMLGPWAVIRPQDYLIETTLGTLFFIMPNTKKLYNNGLYDIIKKNQQTFITPYDIHNTLIHLACGDNECNPNAYSKRGSSLLLNIEPMERYCENPKLDLRIEKSDCKCKKYKYKGV